MVMSPRGIGSWTSAHPLCGLAFGCLHPALSCCPQLARLWSLGSQLNGGKLAFALGSCFCFDKGVNPQTSLFSSLHWPLLWETLFTVHVSKYSLVFLLKPLL